MLRILRWIRFITFSLIGLVGLFSLLAYHFASGSLPDYERDFSVEGLTSSVEIIRDNHAVPHIFVTNNNDAYFGLGFAHAQDRLWQMLISRRMAEGRMAEIFGAEHLEQDVFMRRLTLAQLGQKAFHAQTPDGKAALDAYARGVNAYLKAVQKLALGRGAPEHFIYSQPIEPWQAADSLTLLKYQAFRSSPHLRHEIMQSKAFVVLAQEKFSDLFPESPFDGGFELQQSNLILSEQTRLAEMPSYIPASSGASNIWAAGPNRTATKASLLAVDPHGTVQAPSEWMLARIELSSGGVIGATIPGIPLVFHGRNTKIAWGLTASHIDDIDIVNEEVDPDDSARYRTAVASQSFIKRSVVIPIADQSPTTIDIIHGPNGPIFWPAELGLEQVLPIGTRPALRSQIFKPDDPSFSHLLKLHIAQTAQTAGQGFDNYIAPSFNLALADKENISLQTIGHIPNRNADYQGQGRFPADAWRIKNQWLSKSAENTTARLSNPESGIVLNTNNNVALQDFPNHGSHIWGDDMRIERLSKLLSERNIHTVDSFREAQQDVISVAARNILPLMAKDLWFRPVEDQGNRALLRRKEALDLLANWNGEMSKFLAEPLIYQAWVERFQYYIIRDDLGPLAKEFRRTRPIFLERVLRNIDGAADWCDIRLSASIESCNEIATQSLDDALLALSEQYSDRVESWRWGEAHQLYQNHTQLSDRQIINWFSDIRFEVSGGDHTLNRSQITSRDPSDFNSQNAAGFRALIDFSDPDRSLYVISTGQSGHPLSKHYDDMARLWANGEYIQMSLEQEFVRAGAIGQSILSPAGQSLEN